MQCFYEETPKCNIIAIYEDGSGACLFGLHDDGCTFFDSETGMNIHSPEWFTDSGYLWWLPLPDDFVFFYERNQDNDQ